ncbi:hypothetical protein H257_18157, partial [Aphanomyces astaci]
MALIMVMIVHDASAERVVDPECGECTNCYFAGDNKCMLWWTKAECDSVVESKWCGAGSNDLLPLPPNDLLQPPQLLPPHLKDPLPCPPNEQLPQNEQLPPNEQLPLNEQLPPNEYLPPNEPFWSTPNE